jgi:hypothetical protein
MTNRQRLQQILGSNPTSNCGQPPNPPLIPSNRTAEARRQRAQQTNNQYGNFLQFVSRALNEVSNLTPSQISRFVSTLSNWLGIDNPVGFLESLRTGELNILLGEVAPIVASWLADNLGSVAGGGRGRKLRGTNIASVLPRLISSFPFNELSGVLGSVGSTPTGFGGYSLADLSSGNTPTGYAPAPDYSGQPSTIEIPQDQPNVEEIPSQYDNG